MPRVRHRRLRLRPHRSRALRVCGAAWVAAALASCGGPADPGASLAQVVHGRKAAKRPAAIAHDPLRGRVVHVVDGDTIDARLSDGSIQRVRLIGIDTPEKFTTRAGHVECGGEDASRATRTIAARWLDVTLEPDRTQDAYDMYGRLLAYVVPDADRSTTFQEAILREGWAKVYVYDHHPFARVTAFRRAAGQAREGDRGVWRSCGGDYRRAEGN
ncbi:MAG: thermonuclease family protein [Solirubrobacteraceae bacterium]